MPASYADLLDYFNQRYHRDIDRMLIRDAIPKLKSCQFEYNTNKSSRSYEEQYQYLLQHMDSNSSTEREFLDYLYTNNLRLPDSAQKTVEDILGKDCELILAQKPFRPTVDDLHKNGRNFPPNFLHESWMDYLYWDIELEP